MKHYARYTVHNGEIQVVEISNPAPAESLGALEAVADHAGVEPLLLDAHWDRPDERPQYIDLLRNSLKDAGITMLSTISTNTPISVKPTE